MTRICRTSDGPPTACAAWLSFLVALGAMVAWCGCRIERVAPPEGANEQSSAPQDSQQKPEDTQPQGTQTQGEDTQAEDAQIEPEETQPEEAQPEETPPEETQPEETPPEDTQAEDVQAEPEEAAPDPQVVWEDLLKKAREHLESDALDKAAQTLAELKRVELKPTTEQTKQVAAAEAELERRLKDRRLQEAMQRLASPKRADVRNAQNCLFERFEAALPLLRRAVAEENPLLVRNTLETLRKLQRPEVTLPIMVDVLGNVDQQQNWPDAIRQIELTAAAGAGESLLKLALSSELPEQRAAALNALGRVVDPPRRTAAALLPMIHEDGPELAGALVAAAHALDTHRQQDLWSLKGLEMELSSGQLQQIGSLPQRLSQIITSSGEAGLPTEAVVAAKMLAVTTRQIAAEPLPGVRVLAFGAETAGSPAAAVLDGAWNTVTAEQMWRHPITQEASILLDLGTERTVAGVRVWNFNEAGGTQRGWKEFAVYVGRTPATMSDPVATGIVAKAPGVVDAPDYSVTLPISFVRGRYVRLEANGFWAKDSHTGLTEVQVLGF